MTWLYLLKESSEVFSVIELFFNEIKNQFSTYVHMICTNNVLEYVKNDVSFFVLKMGLFIKLLALTDPNRMALLNASKDIS